MQKRTFDLQVRKRKFQIIVSGKATLLIPPFVATLLIPIPFLSAIFFGIVAAALLGAQIVLWASGRKGFYSKDAEYVRITISSEALKKKL